MKSWPRRKNVGEILNQDTAPFNLTPPTPNVWAGQWQGSVILLSPKWTIFITRPQSGEKGGHALAAPPAFSEASISSCIATLLKCADKNKDWDRWAGGFLLWLTAATWINEHKSNEMWLNVIKYSSQLFMLPGYVWS